MKLPGAGYVGRFAPSPTGPLHIGSLIAAVASYADARHHSGRWLLRIEDLDPPREPPGASQRILHTLVAHGLHWDGEPLLQSQRQAHYAANLEYLQRAGLCYYCDCSRARQAKHHGIYDGHCRLRHPDANAQVAIRVQVNDSPINFDDAIQGPQSQCLSHAVGDFVIRRKDGLYAYQLAVVVDDAEQHISHVVRGADLLSSTARQIYLQRLLGLPTPQYAHFPVAGDSKGHKLSKQNHAEPIDDSQASSNLRAALRFLRQPDPPTRLLLPEDILQWASSHWQRSAIDHAQLIRW